VILCSGGIQTVFELTHVANIGIGKGFGKYFNKKIPAISLNLFILHVKKNLNKVKPLLG
jgi:hypothetical protein